MIPRSHAGSASCQPAGAESEDRGAGSQSGYQSAGLNLYSSLYNTPGSVAAPYFTYNHSACVVNYTGCHTGGSSITGVAFYQGGSYPAAYNGALFFADHTQ